MLPSFEEESGAKIVYVPGNSTDTLAKLQAQKSKQELDVVFLDDGGVLVGRVVARDDEAVELAKRFSTDDSGKFVNGVLSALVGDLRP